MSLCITKHYLCTCDTLTDCISPDDQGGSHIIPARNKTGFRLPEGPLFQLWAEFQRTEPEQHEGK